MNYAASELRSVAKTIQEVTSSSAGGGIRGLGLVSGNPAVTISDSDDNSYFGKNIQTADQRTDQILQRLKQHTDLHNTKHQGYSKDHGPIHQGRHIARIKGVKIRRK